MGKFVLCSGLLLGSWLGLQANGQEIRPSEPVQTVSSSPAFGWFYNDYGPYSFARAVQIKNDWAAQGYTVEVVGGRGSYYVRLWQYQ